MMALEPQNANFSDANLLKWHYLMVKFGRTPYVVSVTLILHPSYVNPNEVPGTPSLPLLSDVIYELLLRVERYLT